LKNRLPILLDLPSISLISLSAMTLVLLGAAWTFAIFAGTTITNVPNVGTYLLGDIGTFPGSALTGFPPGVIYGDTYLAGSYAEIVIGDIRKAYNNATGQASTHTSSDIDLGGLTLFPGVYKFDAAAALSAGQLFFDAQGDVDAVWIFQIGSSLNIESGTSMFFTSGLGNANNVFWAVGTSATLKEDVSFIGNILAYTSISCNARVTVNGRLLATNGEVTLIQNVVSYPGGLTLSPTTRPTVSPSVSPTFPPSAHPSTIPSASPSAQPTVVPSASPSLHPTLSPSVEPTMVPSASPSVQPTVVPSASPSIHPTLLPSAHPSISASPSVQPTLAPSSFPTTPFVKKSQSNDMSRSNVILASVLGSIGGLIVLGLLVGAAVYLVSTHSSGGGTVTEIGITLPELHGVTPDSEVV
jgi:hypothetical protein